MRCRWGCERAATALQADSCASVCSGSAGISLIAAFAEPDASVRNTTLWSDLPRNRSRGKVPLTIRLSHLVQSSAIITLPAPTFTKDETLRDNYTRYQQPAERCLRNQTGAVYLP